MKIPLMTRGADLSGPERTIVALAAFIVAAALAITIAMPVLEWILRVRHAMGISGASQ